MLALSAGWEVAGVVAACLAAVFGAWAVWLQLDSRRALLTVTFDRGPQGFTLGGANFVDYIVHIQNDGHVAVREVKATGFVDGVEVETIGDTRNLVPGGGQAAFSIRAEVEPGVQDPFAGRKLTARIDYNRRSKIVEWSTVTTLR
jgi:hypothetical protein